MPLKKNPLEDARNRLKEKLRSIKEQSDYITQFVADYVEKVGQWLLNNKILPV